MGNKNCPQSNKQKNKIVKKADDDVQYKVKEKRINSSERLPNHFVNRIHEKKRINSNAEVIENNFSTPKRVAVISSFYKSEHTPRKTNLPEKDVKILKILAKK